MLWEMFKHLSNLCPIYLNVMNEDENSSPKTYALIEECTYNESYIKGDGTDLLRKNQFTIRIFSKEENSTNIKNIANAYKEVLKANDLTFNQIGPVFDPMSNNLTVMLSSSYIYG